MFETCRLYRNVQGRYFEEVTEQAGVLNDEGKSMGVAIADFNEDGWPDIVTARSGAPNAIWFSTPPSRPRSD